MTTKELTPIVTANTLAIAETSKALVETNKAIAETSKAIAHLTNSLLTLHDSVKTLAVTVAAHDDQIEALVEAAGKHEAVLANIEKQWQAYINTLPRS